LKKLMKKKKKIATEAEAAAVHKHTTERNYGDSEYKHTTKRTKVMTAEKKRKK